MRIWTACAALAACLAAAPVQANTLVYLCQGYGEESGADRVAVTAVIGQDGQRKGLSLSWSPLQTVEASAKAGFIADLDLWLHYPDYAPGQPDMATGAILSLTALSPPGKRVAPARLYRDLTALRIEASFGAEPVPVTGGSDNTATDLPMTASRSAQLAIPAGSREVRITIRDAKGRVVKTSRFNLTTVRRDHLLPPAIAAAERAAGDYRTCERTG